MRRTAFILALLSVVALVAYAQSSTPTTPNQSIDSGVVRGRVLTADADTPLRSARVQAISGNGPLAAVVTDRDGQFEMRALPPGQYRLSVSKTGYVPMPSAERGVGNAAAVVDVSTGSAVIDLRMVKGGAISGRIADTRGDPLIGMTVNATRPGDPLQQPIATAETDDRGDYRLGDLPSGQYVVAVTSISALLNRDGILLNQNTFGGPMRAGRDLTASETASQMRVYYPGVQRVDAALPIPLSVGEERSSVDFSAPTRRPIDSFAALTSKAVPDDTASSNLAGTVRGQVLVDGRPCAQATVRVVPVPTDLTSVPPAVVTDGDGRYEFRRLASSTFTVIALKPGFLPTHYGQTTSPLDGEPIELRRGETRERVDISLLRPGVITGRVVDENGDPVERVRIDLVQVRYRDGRRRLVEAGGLGTHRSDDRGVYRIYGLKPDDYIVSATMGDVASGLPIVDVPGYTVTYYPGSSNPGEAQRVRVAVGDEASDLDFALARAPTARIAGTIVDATGNPVQSGLILAASRRSGVLAADPIGARQFPDGSFEFTNVAPGEYVIQALKRDRRNERSLYDEGESVSQFVSVTGGDITGLNLRMTSGSTVTGRLSFEGDAAPDLYSAVNVSAVPLDFDRTPQNLGFPASAEIEPGLTLTLTGLTGARVLRLIDPPAGWMLKAVVLNGRDVTDTPLVFGGPAQSVEGLEVVVTNRTSEMTGHIVDARGRAAVGATAVIFSTDRRQWTAASRFMAVSLAADRTGAFSITNVTPSAYYVAALTTLARDEWRDPDLLELLIPSAAQVNISEGERVTVGLRIVAR